MAPLAEKGLALVLQLLVWKLDLLYTHDFVLFLSNPLSSVPVTIDIVNEFDVFSGYKGNYVKFLALPFGNLRYSNISNIPFQLLLMGLIT